MVIHFNIQLIMVMFSKILYNNRNLLNGTNINIFKDIYTYKIAVLSSIQHNHYKSKTKFYTNFPYQFILLNEYQHFILLTFSHFSNPVNVIHDMSVLQKTFFATYQISKINFLIKINKQTEYTFLLKKNNRNTNTVQQPTVVKVTCNMPYYKHKFRQLIEDINMELKHKTYKEFYPSTVFVSNIDYSGKPHKENLSPYNLPSVNTTIESNQKELNYAYMNSSRLPVKKTSTGSDDATNIN